MIICSFAIAFLLFNYDRFRCDLKKQTFYLNLRPKPHGSSLPVCMKVPMPTLVGSFIFRALPVEGGPVLSFWRSLMPSVCLRDDCRFYTAFFALSAPVDFAIIRRPDGSYLDSSPGRFWL